MPPDEPPPKSPPDVVLLHSATEDGKGARVIRLRDETIEAGEVRPLEEGKAIAGEVVKLKPREENQRVCDVEVVQGKPSARPTSKGPAQVASSEYRDNWGRIFGPPKTTKADAPN
jgi:hypothetical protein